MIKKLIICSMTAIMIASTAYSQINVYSKGYEGEFDGREIKKKSSNINLDSKSAVYDAEELDKPKNNYINLGIALSRINQEGVSSLKNYGSVFFTIGKTFYIDDVRISDNVLFGIDATWFDFNYASYKVKYKTYLSTETYNYDQLDFAVQVGPSLTYSPTYDVSIHGYCRYAPSYSLLLLDNENYGNLGHFVVFGANASYRSVGLGIEGRFGSCKYSDLADQEVGFVSDKIKTSAFRAYLTFKF